MVPRRYRGRSYVFLETRDYITSLTAFYTAKNIIEAMYKGVMNLGFDGGNILDMKVA